MKKMPPRDASGKFVSYKTRVESGFGAVQQSAEKAAFRNLGHAIASINRDAKASIQRSPSPGSAGQPPKTRKGQLKRGIRFAYDKQSAVSGPMFSAVGTSASAHEFGKSYKGQKFAARPFMAPALQRAVPRFASSWRASVHS